MKSRIVTAITIEDSIPSATLDKTSHLRYLL
jgi:hypothetical protein